MILANYASWFAGEWSIFALAEKIEGSVLNNNPLLNAPKFIITMAAMTFVVTLILEWPFCLWALKTKKNKILKSIAACLLVNICSYAFLVWLYCQASSYTLYTDLSIRAVDSFSKNNNAWIYYISPQDGDIHRIHPNGNNDENIHDLNMPVKSNKNFCNGDLFVWPSEKENSWDLWISYFCSEKENQLLIKDFAVKTAKPYSSYYTTRDVNEPNKVDGNYLSTFCSTNLTENKSDWNIHTECWAIEGLVAEKKSSKEYLRFAFETPFVKWFSSKSTLLPDDQVVYQLGNQIVLLDLNKRQIGLITLGFSPIVALK
jgi:hypothetical protein